MFNKLSKDVIVLIFQFACAEFRELINFGLCNTLMRSASLHKRCFEYMSNVIHIHELLENHMTKTIEKINKTRTLEGIFGVNPKRRKTASKFNDTYNTLVDDYNKTMSVKIVNLIECVVKFKGVECIKLGSSIMSPIPRTSKFFMDNAFYYLQPDVLKKISEKLKHANIKKLLLYNLTTTQIDELKIPSAVYSICIKTTNYVKTLPCLFFNNKNLTEVSLSSHKYTNKLLKNIGRDLQNVVKLKINCTGIKPKVLTNISMCKKLKELTAYNVEVDVEIDSMEERIMAWDLMDEIFSIPSLLKIDIANCRWSSARRVWSIQKNLTHLNISDAELWDVWLNNILDSNKKLLELNICDTDVFDGRGGVSVIYNIVAMFTTLTCLDISNTEINDDSLTRISIGLVDLKIIYLYNCQMLNGPGIFAISINSKKLELIDICSTIIPSYYVDLFKKNNKAIVRI